MGIPYWNIPIRTIKTKDGWRLSKYALMGFLERLNEEMDEMIDETKSQMDGKGRETYSSDM